jgi:3-phosphoglycerate kinase
MYSNKDTKATIVLFDDDFYTYAFSDSEKKSREKSKKENFEKIKEMFGDFDIGEDTIESWMGTDELVEAAKEKNASEIIIIGGGKKMVSLAKKLIEKNKVIVTFVPED